MTAQQVRHIIWLKLLGCSILVAGLIAAAAMTVPSIVGAIPLLSAVANPALAGMTIAVAGVLTAILALACRWLISLPGDETGQGNELMAEIDVERRRWVAENIDPNGWIRALRILTHAPRSTAILLGGSGTLLAIIAALPIPWPAPVAAMAGIGFALDGLALAVAARPPVLLDEAPREASAGVDALQRPTGTDLLESLRESNVYRRQDCFERSLNGRPIVKGDGLEDLLQRHPLLADWLPRTGVRFLTRQQTVALRALLRAEQSSATRTADFVLHGWPGSGRSTLVNLMTLGAMIGREGTVYCVSAETGARVEKGALDVLRGEARNAADQLRQWIGGDATLQNRLQELRSDDRRVDLAWDRQPSVLFTDVRALTERLLRSVRDDAMGFVQRLRYVVIDQPDQMTREELIRLRMAIARLRLAAEVLGRDVTFIVLVSPIDNAAQLAKWLLNNSDCSVLEFDLWCESVTVVGWEPPRELEDIDAPLPFFVREPFVDECIGVLAELAIEAQRLFAKASGLPGLRPMKIGVVDAGPVLGPEARSFLGASVLERIKEGRPFEVGVLQLDTELCFLSRANVSTYLARSFDVLISLGVGPHPGRLVMSLRGALAKDGILLLLSDGSPDDTASMRIMSVPDWDPLDIDGYADLPSVLLPDHASAVIASELAATLDQFADLLLPAWRLPEVFPSREASELIRTWIAFGHLALVRAFHRGPGRRGLEERSFLRLVGDGIQAEHWRVPWGCTSTEVYAIYDVTALAEGYSERREVTGEVDAHRVFIDLFPGAYLRFPPNTLEVIGPRLDMDRPRSEEDERWLRRMGQIDVRQPTASDARQIDRRHLRTHFRLVEDHVPDSARLPSVGTGPNSPVASRGALDGDPITRVVASALGDREPDIGRIQLSLQTLHPIRSGHQPALYVVSGLWEVTAEEQFRDVVATDERLEEDPSHVRMALAHPLGGVVPRRSYRCSAAHMFLVLEAPPGGAEDESRREGSASWRAVAFERAAVQGIARMIELYLRRIFLRFDMEYAVEVVASTSGMDAPEWIGADAIDSKRGVGQEPAMKSGEGVEGRLVIVPWRIVVRRRYSDELRDDPQLDFLRRAELCDQVLPWVRDALENCSCSDGCPACCGGLGYASLAEADKARRVWKPTDLVTRWGAYVLVCELLGTTPRWDRYLGPFVREELKRPRTMRESELEAAVREIVGTSHRGYVDGLWARLFDRYMPMSEMVEQVASAEWGDDSVFGDNVVGFYNSHRNLVLLKRERDAQETRTTIVHEYTHNWQYKSKRFHLLEHRHGDEVQQYFEGKLVIEGHARWADHAYRNLVGRGKAYAPDDAHDWDEYKTGYYLMERIERTFGERGLFLWLEYGSSFTPARHGFAPRSRDDRLPKFPFSVTEALQAFGLFRRALEGSMLHDDIKEGGGLEAEGELAAIRQ